MAAIQSLRDALGALRREPVVFVGGLAVGIVLLPQNALSQFGVPVLPNLLQILTFFVTPFLLAGIVAMASEALDGSTGLATLTERGKAHYVQMLLGKLIEFAIYVLWVVLLALFGIALVVVGIFVLGISASAGAGESLVSAAGIVGILATVVLLGIPVLLFLAVRILIQLFPAAIVTDDVDAVEGYKRSVSAVRADPLGAVGVWLVNIVVSFLVGSPLTLFVFYRLYRRFDTLRTAGAQAGVDAGAGAGMGALFSTPETVAIIAGTVLLTALTRPFSLAYETAFYERVTDDEVAASSTDDTDAIGPTTAVTTSDERGATATPGNETDEAPAEESRENGTTADPAESDFEFGVVDEASDSGDSTDVADGATDDRDDRDDRDD